jgi:hypothetical protein
LPEFVHILCTIYQHVVNVNRIIIAGSIAGLCFVWGEPRQGRQIERSSTREFVFFFKEALHGFRRPLIYVFGKERKDIDRLQSHVVGVDKRVVRLETLVEVAKYQPRLTDKSK